MNCPKITVGEYIVVQRHNYKKIHKYNKADSCITLGRDIIDLSGIQDCPYYSIFKMIPKTTQKKKEFSLELSDETTCLVDEINVQSSGMDNRNIVDNGLSQKLTAAEIEELKSDVTEASDIVEMLISNSNTFCNKTEFSQEKYLRKKEKKYYQFVQILYPNLRIISEIMFKLDPPKIQSIRIDTLSQIITQSNISSEGIHLLYDSGSNGLLSAALLNAIGSNTVGKLVHLHPGNMSQKQALLAMNFKEEHLNRCISVNVYSVLRHFYQGSDTHSCSELEEKNGYKRKLPLEHKHQKIAKLSDTASDSEVCKDQKSPPKIPKWHFDNIAASQLLHEKADSLIIACKEDPLNIFNEMISFVKPSRPFVVYYPVAEPLQHMYTKLKTQSNIAALKLTFNWMRNYQVLSDRTHPEMAMNASSGFLLTGYVLKNS